MKNAKNPIHYKYVTNISRLFVIGGLFLMTLSACNNRIKQANDTFQTSSQSFNPVQQISFSDNSWQERIFAGSTTYQVINPKDKGSEILKASTNGHASMRYKAVNINLIQTPFIQWDWKISNTYKHKNERSRKGDDFPARIYIAISNKTGSIFPRALTYVWSSHSIPLSSWKNPYTNTVIMMSLQNGEANNQQWISEKRNLRQDLAQQFGEDIKDIKGIALMTDADNTGSSAVSFYRSLRFTQE